MLPELFEEFQFPLFRSLRPDFIETRDTEHPRAASDIVPVSKTGLH